MAQAAPQEPATQASPRTPATSDPDGRPSRSSLLQLYHSQRPASASNRPRALLNRVAAAAGLLGTEDSEPDIDNETWVLEGWGEDASVPDKACEASKKMLPAWARNLPTPLPTGAGTAGTGSRRMNSAGTSRPSAGLRGQTGSRQTNTHTSLPARTQVVGRGSQRAARPRLRPTAQPMADLEVGDESDLEPHQVLAQRARQAPTDPPHWQPAARHQDATRPPPAQQDAALAANAGLTGHQESHVQHRQQVQPASREPSRSCAASPARHTGSAISSVMSPRSGAGTPQRTTNPMGQPLTRTAAAAGGGPRVSNTSAIAAVAAALLPPIAPAPSAAARQSSLRAIGAAAGSTTAAAVSRQTSLRSNGSAGPWGPGGTAEAACESAKARLATELEALSQHRTTLQKQHSLPCGSAPVLTAMTAGWGSAGTTGVPIVLQPPVCASALVPQAGMYAASCTGAQAPELGLQGQTLALSGGPPARGSSLKGWGRPPIDAQCAAEATRQQQRQGRGAQDRGHSSNNNGSEYCRGPAGGRGVEGSSWEAGSIPIGTAAGSLHPGGGKGPPPPTHKASARCGGSTEAVQGWDTGAELKYADLLGADSLQGTLASSGQGLEDRDGQLQDASVSQVDQVHRQGSHRCISTGTFPAGTAGVKSLCGPTQPLLAASERDAAGGAEGPVPHVLTAPAEAKQLAVLGAAATARPPDRPLAQPKGRHSAGIIGVGAVDRCTKPLVKVAGQRQRLSHTGVALTAKQFPVDLPPQWTQADTLSNHAGLRL